MTDSLIRYQQNVETARHNRATEYLSRFETETQAQTSRYATDTSAATSRYVADTNAATQRYVSDQNTATQLKTAEMSTSASRYATDVNAATARYASDQSAAVNRERASIESADRRAQLQLNRQTQLAMTALERRRVNLEQLRTTAQNEQTHAQTKKLLNDITVSLQGLQNDAARLGLDKQAAEYENALKQAQTWAARAKTAETIANAADKTYSLISRILSDWHNQNYGGLS